MPPRCPPSSIFLLPFLYPSLALPIRLNAARTFASFSARHSQSSPDQPSTDSSNTHLNPPPDDYASTNFADKARLRLYPGPGGNGCVSFLREAYFPNGPPNGGDGGHGGNVYIQAVPGETSLHKLTRRRFVRAGRGRHGRGNAQGGQKGEDVVITVPIGTVVRELERYDPTAEEALLSRARRKEKKRRRLEAEAAALRARRDPDARNEEVQETTAMEGEEEDLDRHKWMLFPGLSKSDGAKTAFPPLPRRERLFYQPAAPIILDLKRPTPQPILLAAGGLGGLGNPHFVSRDRPRPLIATRGEAAMTMTIEMELKLLADLGLVGLPNAGKSTLLRSLTNSRTRVGNWAFTTLQPNIGTVVLDKYRGRPAVRSFVKYPAAPQLGLPEEEVAVEPRTRFTVADIPGLIEGAHLDRGLGIAFLRHVERARALAFVVDLGAGNAVKALDALWNEVGLYARMREEEELDREIASRVDWSLTSEPSPTAPSPPVWDQGQSVRVEDYAPAPANTTSLQIASKPWFVVATKADLPETKSNYEELKAYVEGIQEGTNPHPTKLAEAWTKRCAVIPVSAINGHNVQGIVHWTVGLLDDTDS